MITDVSLLENAPFSFLEFGDNYLYIFGIMEDTWSGLDAGNSAVKGLVVTV